jgi:hypothetical protein
VLYLLLFLVIKKQSIKKKESEKKGELRKKSCEERVESSLCLCAQVLNFISSHTISHYPSLVQNFAWV